MRSVAVIDIGSNSVRLAIFNSGQVVYRTLVTSRLAEGMVGNVLNSISLKRTVEAIVALKEMAVSQNVGTIYAFATEAVRKAVNRADFLCEVKLASGLDVYVTTCEEEANLAVEGALLGNDGCVIDLGGASTEVAIKKNGKVVYSRSLPLGAVRLNDVCGQDKVQLVPYIAQKIEFYGNVPYDGNAVVVGGTATSLAACALGLKVYSVQEVNGSVFTIECLKNLIEEFEGKSSNQICEKHCIDSRRAEIIYGGATLLYMIMSKIGVKRFTVSECDNLDGFYKLLKEGLINATPIFL